MPDFAWARNCIAGMGLGRSSGSKVCQSRHGGVGRSANSERRCRGVILFDPNSVNPYGRELARVLQRDWCVTLYCSSAVKWAPGKAIQNHTVLASSRAEDGLLWTVLRRFKGPLRALGAALVRQQPLIVVWSRHSWESILFAFAAVLGAPVIVVNHNPSALRPKGGLRSRAEAVLKRAAPVTVILAEELTDAARLESNNVMVAAHPSFAGWREQYLPAGRKGSGRETGRRRVLLLGALRPDKGIDAVPEVVEAIHHHAITIVLAGSGDPPKRWHDAIRSAGAEIARVGSSGFIDDESLAEALNDSDLLLAPYVGATQSSTAILALTCGLPVIAYRVGGLPGILKDRSLTPTREPRVLGARVDSFLSDPWETWRLTASDLDDTSASGWFRAIALVHPCRFAQGCRQSD